MGRELKEREGKSAEEKGKNHYRDGEKKNSAAAEVVDQDEGDESEDEIRDGDG